MQDKSYKLLVEKLSLQVRGAQFSQEKLALAMKVSQSQISRVLSGKCKRRSKLFDGLCIYVSNQTKGVTIHAVQESTEMLEAIASIWDGSTEQAQSIAIAIRGLKPLCNASERLK